MSARGFIPALALALVLAAGTPGGARAGEGQPNAADLLFETPQFAAAPLGTALAYEYRRAVANPAVFGPSFADRMTLKVAAPEEGAAQPDQRTVEVDFFTGERHRAAGPFADVTTNPVLLLFLENHVQDLAARLHANPRYLKTAIRAALRDQAQVVPAQVPFKGGTVPGWTVRITPFRNDPNMDRMQGLEGLTYDFKVAAAVPGSIAALRIAAPGPAGAPLWEEDLAYDPDGS